MKRQSGSRGSLQEREITDLEIDDEDEEFYSDEEDIDGE